jgi:hypothetical protein
MARRRKQTTKPNVATKSGRNTKVASPKIAKPLHDVTFPNESASYRVGSSRTRRPHCFRKMRS